MPEDAQPNDLRGRSQASGVPSIRPAGNIPRNNHYASTARTSYKRPSDPSYVVSPQKRRKLVDKKEIEIQLPVGCRKGQNGCHTKRKEFIAREIERLQKPGLGLKVLSHTVKDDAVQFIYTQEDIMNCFLAPSAPVKGGQQQHAGSQPKAEPLPQILSPPKAIISTIPGPPRVFKSGTLSFSADLSVGAETPAERVVNRPSGAFNTDLDHSVAVAELMFGKQGPPEPSSSGRATSAPAPSMNDPPVSLVVKPVPPQSQFQAPASITQSASLPNKVQTAAKQPFVVHRPLGVFDADLDHSIPVAELMFGKQGPPKPSSFIAAASASAPAKNHAPASGSGSRAVKSVPLQPRSQATVSTTQSVSRLNQAKTAEKKQSLSESVKSTPSTIPSSSLLRKVQTTAKQSLSSQPTSSTGALHPPPPSLPKVQTAADQPSADSSPPVTPLHIPPPPRSVDSSPLNHTCELDGEELRIPFRASQDKLRRFLCGTSPSSSLIVSMHGTLEGVDVTSRKHWFITQEPMPTKEAVDDACVVTVRDRSVVILGHSRDDQQLSLIDITKTGNNVASALDLKRPWNPAKKGGTSAVAPMMQPSMFASGGYDHGVHLWTINDDLSSATPQATTIKHNSQIQSLLAIRDTSHKLVSAGADCSVHIWDLSSERVVNTLKTSNSVYHVHSTTSLSPFCSLLEVAHREQQFEVRDHRYVPAIPVQRFGYTTLQVHGRFIKGSSLSNYFASGDRVGYVRLWDLRNVEKPCAEIECFNGLKISHLVFQSSRLLACAENNQIRLVKYDQSI